MSRKFDLTQQESAIAELCSVDLTAPTQIQTEDAVPLVAGVWFHTPKERIETENGVHSLSYGFSAAMVQIKAEDCRIDPQHRCSVIAQRLKVASSKSSATDKKAEGGAGLGLETPKSLGVFSARGKLGGDLSKVVSERTTENGELIREICSVWPGPSDTWHLRGNASDEPALIGQILGGESDGTPMCHLIEVGLGAAVEARVVADLDDVWVETDSGESDQAAAANRKAVCAVLIKRAIGRKRADADSGTGRVTLATARLARFEGEPE